MADHWSHTDIFAQGGGGDGRGGATSSSGGGPSSDGATTGAPNNPSASSATSNNTPNDSKQQSTCAMPSDPSQKGTASGLCYKDREERVRQMRERQQSERQQKLEELKEQAAASQKFREQQETLRKQRLEEMRSRETERRTHVEERRRIIEQAEQERRETVIRRSAEREQRHELKRRQERSSNVFAFGSSTPRMLDPKENIPGYWASRRATSTTNVNMVDSNSAARRASECTETDLSRKRATSAHSLNRKPEDDLMTRSFTNSVPTAARRRTDLLPAMPPVRDNRSSKTSPRHRSPGRAISLSRLDQLARPKHQRANPPLTPLHETAATPSPSSQSMKPARTMSKSMSHLGPQRLRPSIGPTTDGIGVPIAEGSLDRGTSRSSLALSQPRMTRAEVLRQNKLRGTAVKTAKSHTDTTGVRSGTVTPSSRPTSALSQGSGGSQVVLRQRSSPRKARPLSIAGSTPSSVDKPHENVSSCASSAVASPSRESRPIERKSSLSNGVTKPPRTKSAGSDSSTPSTPQKAPSKGAVPKRTPAQVKAESAAKKASEKNKMVKKVQVTPKATPSQSPSVEAKALPGGEKKATPIKPKESPPPPPQAVVEEKTAADNKEVTPAPPNVENTDATPVPTPSSEETPKIKPETVASEVLPKDEQVSNPLIEALQVVDTQEYKKEENTSQSKEPKQDLQNDITVKEKEKEQSSSPVEVNIIPEAAPPLSDDKSQTQAEEDSKTQGQKVSEKPVTGYQSEEEYKAVLAEKRRQAREAKERELESERQRKLEEEERERREEEEYLRMIEEQKKAEEERLKKAILDAEKLREEEAKKREEEEKQRIENEKIEQQKMLEAEEKLKKEEEERQARKSRVAAIMARTRSKGGSSTPSKPEAKTPSEEGRNLNDAIITESFIANMSSSMTDSMIVEAIESHQAQKPIFQTNSQDPTSFTTSVHSPLESTPSTQSSISTHSTEKSVTFSDQSSQPPSDVSSQPLSDISSIAPSTIEIGSSEHSQSTTPLVDEAFIRVLPTPEAHLNGEGTVAMETTPTSQPVDLLGSFTGVNGISQNGIHGTETHIKSGDAFNTFDPLADTKSETFDQIIDLNQTKLNNEDAVNCNPPPPIIAFEDNINKKQTQDRTNNVPDLLL